jgi:hypothetical protein
MTAAGLSRQRSLWALYTPPVCGGRGGAMTRMTWWHGAQARGQPGATSSHAPGARLPTHAMVPPRQA